MVGGLTGCATLEPGSVTRLDLRRNLALGMKPQRYLVNTPGRSQ
jgi:hypothetical protein